MTRAVEEKISEGEKQRGTRVAKARQHKRRETLLLPLFKSSSKRKKRGEFYFFRPEDFRRGDKQKDFERRDREDYPLLQLQTSASIFASLSQNKTAKKTIEKKIGEK